VQDAAAFGTQQGVGRVSPLKRARALARASAPTRSQAALATLSALLVVLSFPDFDLWPLAWVGLVPLALAVLRARPTQAFALGWLWGVLFFYGSCWWLTHSMIHYGGIPPAVAFALLLPPTVIVGVFPALWALLIARASALWGAKALALAPFAWAALEWLRLTATGQLWNALGYSQAYQPAVIQPAAWGGVYAVSFLLVAVNAALAFALVRRSLRGASVAAAAALLVMLTVILADFDPRPDTRPSDFIEHPGVAAVVVAVQPNVSPDFDRSVEEEQALVARHLSMSAHALQAFDPAATRKAQEHQSALEAGLLELPPFPPRLVVWPESPMNFRWERDAEFREVVSNFARANRASVLFNALEPAPAGGAYNSAVMVNERGQLVARYDKIRLLPFGEYVPLPRWLGGGLVGALVGEFTPGADYTLLPAGDMKAGVFICFESAFPALSREFTGAGADLLINISNDGYLGRTPVLRQHLANAVFRAVENRREVLRVTNTGITARITPRGEVLDATGSFEAAARTWAVSRATPGQTFYTRRGDLFVALCALVTVLSVVGGQLSVVRASRKSAVEAGDQAARRDKTTDR
jgi:apolipoprotein N-acyltransferase